MSQPEKTIDTLEANAVPGPTESAADLPDTPADQAADDIPEASANADPGPTESAADLPDTPADQAADDIPEAPANAAPDSSESAANQPDLTADQSEITRLLYYRDLTAVTGESVRLVQHVESGKTYAKKELRDYDRSVFEYLKMRDLPGTPHIIDIIENFAEADHPDILIVIEEYITGSKLREVLDAYGPLKPDIALDYMIQLCQILAPLHDRKRPIVHTRITADNVIVTRNGMIYLINFDNAKEIDLFPDSDTDIGQQSQDDTPLPEMAEDENPPSAYIASGQLPKMPEAENPLSAYIASGQFEYLPAIPQTDILECGSLFREMLTGVSPASPTPRIPLVNRPEVELLDPIITKCTETEVSARYADAAELLKALNGVVPEIKYILSERASVKKRNLPLTILTGILFIGSIIILLLFLTGNWPPFR